MKDQIHLLKKRLRLSMNGVASSSMRERGLDYKLNFGVSVPQLKKIASEFSKNDTLAEYCRNSSSREMQILGSMLQPPETFPPDKAEECVRNFRFIEIAQQYCMNLFQYLPYAEEKAMEWINNDAEIIKITGYLLLLRLFAGNTNISNAHESTFLQHVKKDITSDPFSLRKVCSDCLKRYGRRSRSYAESALKCIISFKGSSNSIERELYDDIEFDLDFYLNKDTE